MKHRRVTIGTLRPAYECYQSTMLSLPATGSRLTSSICALVSVAALASAASCGQVEGDRPQLRKTTGALLGGVVPTQGEGRFVVSIGNCSAAIVSPYALVTARHCVPEGDGSY